MLTRELDEASSRVLVWFHVHQPLEEQQLLDRSVSPAALEVEPGEDEVDGRGARRDRQRSLAGVERGIGPVRERERRGRFGVPGELDR